MKDVQILRSRFTGDLAVLFAMAAFGAILHFAFNGGYGYYHDELYFAACGERFAFGYVDHPPLLPWIALLSVKIFGTSLQGLRFFPALAQAVSIFLTGLLVRRLGGGRFAQFFACLTFLIAPAYLRSGNQLSIPAFEPFFWILCSYLVVRIIQEDRPKLWLWVGLVAGLGLMTKYTMAFYLAGLFVGFILSPLRKQLKSPWIYVGCAIGFLVILPNILWQISHDWLTVKFVLNLNKNVMSNISSGEFLLGQIFYLHPLNLPIWLAGLALFFFVPRGKPYRVLGWIFVVVFIFLLLANSKIYYLAPAFPPLLAGGAILVERFIKKGNRKWLKFALPAVFVFGGALAAPASLPLLPIETADSYIQIVTLGALKNSYEVTNDLHDQFGWEKLASMVANAYERLSVEEKERCIILAANREAAGAIDYFGKSYGLPPARCPVLSYFLWGYGGEPVDMILSVGYEREELERFVNHIEEVSVFTHEHANPWRNNQLIALCRDLKVPFATVWPKLMKLVKVPPKLS